MSSSPASSQSGYIRRATHAGSWYSSSPSHLDAQLSAWLAEVQADKIPAPERVASPSPPPTSRNGVSTSSDPITLPVQGARAIIAPHAGYSYSGPAAAWAYRCIPTTNSSKIKRVFILGPSHHHYLPRCALSSASAYQTPLGNLLVDQKINQEFIALAASSLSSKQDWEWMERKVDEDEHSIEMHASYIRKVFLDRMKREGEEQGSGGGGGGDITIVPILVGAINTQQERYYGRLLAPYLADEENFFVVSSDFCHWGTRFSYTYYRPSPTSSPISLNARSVPDPQTPIHLSIRELDNEGMQAISFPRASIITSNFSTTKSNNNSTAISTTTSSTTATANTANGNGNNEKSELIQTNKSANQASEEFATYLKTTQNTVCGRHPIGILLGALAHLESQEQEKEEGREGTLRADLRFVRYEQSSECKTYKDSSVSYASAFLRFV